LFPFLVVIPEGNLHFLLSSRPQNHREIASRQKPHFGQIIHTTAHVLPSRKLQVNPEETAIKPEDKPRIHHKYLKFTTNAEDRSIRPRKTQVSRSHFVASKIAGKCQGKKA
jgi:hypothetical protein